MKTIDAQGMHYVELNELIRSTLPREKEIRVLNVLGQRYIAAGIKEQCYLELEGVPGNDLGVFMEGPRLMVRGNGQDGIGNTMNDGTIVIHGHGGDVMAYAMRGGEIYVKTNVGYRTGIHMKEYEGKIPTLVIGGRAGDFLGEYLAGGRIIVLGLDGSPGQDLVGNYCGTGMHGGAIYVHGQVPSYKFAREALRVPLEEGDYPFLEEKIDNYCSYFGVPREGVQLEKFIKVKPMGSRPYGNLYAY